MNWYRRNTKVITVACVPITVTLAVIGIMFAITSLLILAGISLVIGAAAFATHTDKAGGEHKMHCRVCGVEGEMALEYESSGICRKCLLHIVHLPGVLGK